jgi:hypothetical protein
MHSNHKVSELSISKLIGELLRDPERKSLVKIFVELGYLFFLYRKVPTHYFSRYLFKKMNTNISDYLPSKFLYNIKSKFNEREARVMLDNKLYFDFYYRQLNFSLPKIWMFNHQQAFVIKNRNCQVTNAESFRKLVEEVIKENSIDGTIFIKKTYGSYQGANIYKLHLDQLISSSEMIDELYARVIKSGYLFQETIRQHPDMAQLNPACLNTIRLDTFINASGEIQLISGYVKTNLRDHYIDNEPTGACEISVDLHTGKLAKYGSLAIKYNGLIRPTRHPITQTTFEDFSIPFFNEAKELAIRAASVVPGLRLVGWDIAIAEAGPILIEGNSDYDIAANDLAYGGYRGNAVFQKVLKEFNYL